MQYTPTPGPAGPAGSTPPASPDGTAVPGPRPPAEAKVIEGHVIDESTREIPIIGSTGAGATATPPAEAGPATDEPTQRLTPVPDQVAAATGVPEAPDTPEAPDAPDALGAEPPEAEVPEAEVPEAEVPEAEVAEAEVPEAEAPEAEGVVETPAVDADADVDVEAPEADDPETDVSEIEGAETEGAVEEPARLQQEAVVEVAPAEDVAVAEEAPAGHEAASAELDTSPPGTSPPDASAEPAAAVTDETVPLSDASPVEAEETAPDTTAEPTLSDEDESEPAAGVVEAASPSEVAGVGEGAGVDAELLEAAVQEEPEVARTEQADAGPAGDETGLLADEPALPSDDEPAEPELVSHATETPEGEAVEAAAAPVDAGSIDAEPADAESATAAPVLAEAEAPEAKAAATEPAEVEAEAEAEPLGTGTTGVEPVEAEAETAETETAETETAETEAKSAEAVAEPVEAQTEQAFAPEAEPVDVEPVEAAAEPEAGPVEAAAEPELAAAEGETAGEADPAAELVADAIAAAYAEEITDVPSGYAALVQAEQVAPEPADAEPEPADAEPETDDAETETDDAEDFVTQPVDAGFPAIDEITDATPGLPTPGADLEAEEDLAGDVAASAQPQGEAVDQAPELEPTEEFVAAAAASLARLRPGDLSDTRIAIWSADAADALRTKLLQAQATFVDDPEAAVREAKAVVTEAVNTLASTLAQALLDSHAHLDPTESSAAADTESLRVAIRGYRDFLERVLAL